MCQWNARGLPLSFQGHSGDVTAGGGPMQAELASLREQVEV